MRVATYGRYSSDLQRETSIEDQLRVARRYAAEQRWQVLSDHIYSDAGISGASINGRPGLQALLAAATLRPAPFDIVLTDDSSRISRDLADALRVMQTLKFHGVRVIYISQGIDSASDQADALITMHGLIDQLYLKETAKKIKRGLQGQLERGYSTGNRTYGYRTVPVPDPSGKLDLNGHPVLLGKKPVICEDEAAVVRQIFEWAVSGIGAQTSVRRLRASSTPGPRGETWKLGAVKRILRNERYLGRLIWGQRTTERKPGSNLKIERPLSRDQWKILEVPELRIISDDVWDQVQARIRAIAPRLEPGTNLARGRLPGHHSKYVLSGFMKCGLCGGAFSIVSCSRTYGPRYSCRRAAREGSCTNRIEIKRKTLEDLLLARLKTELESPEVMAYIAQELRRRVDEAHSRPQERQRLTKELDAERRKLQNLVAALEDGRSSATILEAVRKREANIQRLQQDLTALGRERRAIPVTPEWIRTQLKDLSALLTESGERARTAFRKLSLDIRLHPVRPEGERPHLRAVATGNLAALTGDFTLVDRSKVRAIR
jgi:DNA invertase Pin-like site-specific DNA recombinase